ATAATTAAAPTRPHTENFLLTLPPPTRSDISERTRGRVFRAQAPFSIVRSPGRKAAVYDGRAPKWRNWQTRRTQNPVPERACGFDSHLRHWLTRPAGAAFNGASAFRAAAGGQLIPELRVLGDELAHERDAVRIVEQDDLDPALNE